MKAIVELDDDVVVAVAQAQRGLMGFDAALNHLIRRAALERAVNPPRPFVQRTVELGLRCESDCGGAMLAQLDEGLPLHAD